ncbi:ATP/GTP-binding protein [Nocardiopsis sp. MG754419]|uniref:GTP-binding protein n=1 Tax=Nocardiopsis sp. MG754419 TaxID=2259865 RepID=UPI001BA66ECE|nr:ATP/GTP-binding protein [Nocardiopsis sp. MG754419]MBR8744546.1 ATP/GTP-binding protein [Nocardiopsis sp. MG754419]
MHSNASERTASEPTSLGRPAGERSPLAPTVSNALKIVIVGGFGVGKTTMVGSVSEMRPLSTEEVMTQAGAEVDDLRGVRDKRTTTAAFDFGRITVDATRVLYLFGAPGQKRFWFLWEQLFTGGLGAIVLVDTARVEDSWYAIDRLEHHGMPFVVAVNRFGAGPSLDRVRTALDLSNDVPLLECDARRRESSRDVLITLVHHLASLDRAGSAPKEAS